MGIIIGPALGGALSKWGFALPCYVSAALSGALEMGIFLGNGKSLFRFDSAAACFWEGFKDSLIQKKSLAKLPQLAKHHAKSGAQKYVVIKVNWWYCYCLQKETRKSPSHQPKIIQKSKVLANFCKVLAKKQGTCQKARYLPIFARYLPGKRLDEYLKEPKKTKQENCRGGVPRPELARSHVLFGRATDPTTGGNLAGGFSVRKMICLVLLKTKPSKRPKRGLCLLDLFLGFKAFKKIFQVVTARLPLGSDRFVNPRR